MLQTKTGGKIPISLAAIGAFFFLLAILQTAQAADSGCVTCHLDKEMLKKTGKVDEGKKSAMQSGAG